MVTHVNWLCVCFPFIPFIPDTPSIWYTVNLSSPLHHQLGVILRTDSALAFWPSIEQETSFSGIIGAAPSNDLAPLTYIYSLNTEFMFPRGSVFQNYCYSGSYYLVCLRSQFFLLCSPSTWGSSITGTFSPWFLCLRFRGVSTKDFRPFLEFWMSVLSRHQFPAISL